jgi:hypothetical protein
MSIILIYIATIVSLRAPGIVQDLLPVKSRRRIGLLTAACEMDGRRLVDVFRGDRTGRDLAGAMILIPRSRELGTRLRNGQLGSPTSGQFKLPFSCSSGDQGSGISSGVRRSLRPVMWPAASSTRSLECRRTPVLQKASPECPLGLVRRRAQQREVKNMQIRKVTRARDSEAEKAVCGRMAKVLSLNYARAFNRHRVKVHSSAPVRHASLERQAPVPQGWGLALELLALVPARVTQFAIPLFCLLPTRHLMQVMRSLSCKSGDRGLPLSRLQQTLNYGCAILQAGS